MRKWVEYNFDKDFIVNIDKKRLLKRALDFQHACEEFENELGVNAVAHSYKPYLEAALKGTINVPQHNLPNTREMHNRDLPDRFQTVVNRSSDALESRPAVDGKLDVDTMLYHQEKYIKSENGKHYLLDYFEDDE